MQVYNHKTSFVIIEANVNRHNFIYIFFKWTKTYLYSIYSVALASSRNLAFLLNIKTLKDVLFKNDRFSFFF